MKNLWEFLGYTDMDMDGDIDMEDVLLEDELFDELTKSNHTDTIFDDDDDDDGDFDDIDEYDDN